MSDENVELVRTLYTGAAQSDKAGLLAGLPDIIEQFFDPEIEWSEDPGRADARVRRGHAGVRESFEQWLEGFSEYSFELDEVVDYGDNVLVAGREVGRGSVSGATVSSPIYQVLTLRDGKLLRYREFYDRSAAERAAAEPIDAVPGAGTEA